MPGQSPEVQYHLGKAYYMLGDEASAAQALTEAARSTNNFTGKIDATNLLLILQLDPNSANASTLAHLRAG
jgi:hypothetical protein